MLVQIRTVAIQEGITAITGMDMVTSSEATLDTIIMMMISTTMTTIIITMK
jgi:hypothetical protein